MFSRQTAAGKFASENGTAKKQEQIPGFDISTTVGGQRQISIGSCTQVSGEFCGPSNRPDTGRSNCHRHSTCLSFMWLRRGGEKKKNK